jgi:flagellar hook-basal body complex protein FliE
MPDPISLSGIQHLRNVELAPRVHEPEKAQSTGSFADMLTNAINGVDETMKESEQHIQNFVAGKAENVHDVMISMQRAQLSFQLMVEVRNKAIETYHEISRMQI